MSAANQFITLPFALRGSGSWETVDNDADAFVIYFASSQPVRLDVLWMPLDLRNKVMCLSGSQGLRNKVLAQVHFFQCLHLLLMFFPQLLKLGPGYRQVRPCSSCGQRFFPRWRLEHCLKPRVLVPEHSGKLAGVVSIMDPRVSFFNFFPSSQDLKQKWELGVEDEGIARQ